VVWGIVTAIAAFLKPNPNLHGTHRQLGLPPCPSVVLFHRPCPGCGLTTSFTAMVHGRWDIAWAANPMGLIGYILFTVSALACGYGFVRQWRMDSNLPQIQNAVKWLVIAYLAFGVLRFCFVVYPK
jgi:hypothetical protein